jgi:histidyl-tRNA synthetase
MDKLDRLGTGGVRALLGGGRKDESGDFTSGAGLSSDQANKILHFVTSRPHDPSKEGVFGWLQDIFPSNDLMSLNGAVQTADIMGIIEVAKYTDRVQLDPGIIRGLDYYTGPVFEAQLQFGVKNDVGEEVVFGSVAGGGRYDDLVARFTGQQVPAVGISIGVSRLLSVLKDRSEATLPPLVVVLALDNVQSSFQMAAELRAAGIRAETYVGNKKFGDQLKYADKRDAAIAVIEGSDEIANQKVTLKDLALGAELAKNIESRADWVGNREAQVAVDRSSLAAEVRKMLARK